jgi:hypothetical protein
MNKEHQVCARRRVSEAAESPVDDPNDARTLRGKRRASARPGWAGEKRDFFSLLLAGRPSEMAPTQNMEMKVKHALAAMRTGVDHKAVAGLGNPLQFRNFVAGQHQMPK